MELKSCGCEQDTLGKGKEGLGQYWCEMRNKRSQRENPVHHLSHNPGSLLGCETPRSKVKPKFPVGNHPFPSLLPR